MANDIKFNNSGAILADYLASMQGRSNYINPNIGTLMALNQISGEHTRKDFDNMILDVLATNESGVPATLTLDKPITDYDFLIFNCSRNTQQFNEFLIVDSLTIPNEVIFTSYDTDYIALLINTDTITKVSSNGSMNLFTVYGVKFE